MLVVLVVVLADAGVVGATDSVIVNVEALGAVTSFDSEADEESSCDSGDSDELHAMSVRQSVALNASRFDLCTVARRFTAELFQSRRDPAGTRLVPRCADL